FVSSSFWISHNGRMRSGRLLRVGSPRDPLFFVTDGFVTDGERWWPKATSMDETSDSALVRLTDMPPAEGEPRLIAEQGNAARATVRFRTLRRPPDQGGAGGCGRRSTPLARAAARR